MLEPGRVIAGLKVSRQLGEGPLAATWALEGASGDPVRVLRLLLVRLTEFRKRFQSSAEILMGVQHPHLVQCYDLVEVDGRIGVITEYVGGGNLNDWMKAGDRSPGRVLPMFHRIAVGVGAAHDAGLLHRNLKPSKVLITPRGEPKVSGFALGKITLPEADSNTEVGTTFGTPQYMPPEQFRGVADVDARADLFALGCILYEMFAGHRAFEGADLLEMYKNVLASEYEPLPAPVPAGLVGVVADLLDPERERRPPSVIGLLERLTEDPELAGLLSPGLVREGIGGRSPVTGAAAGPVPVPPPVPPEISSSTLTLGEQSYDELPATSAEVPSPPTEVPPPPTEDASRARPVLAPTQPPVPQSEAGSSLASVQPRRRGGPPSLPPPRSNRAYQSQPPPSPASFNSVPPNRRTPVMPAAPAQPLPAESGFPMWARVALGSNRSGAPARVQRGCGGCRSDGVPGGVGALAFLGRGPLGFVQELVELISRHRPVRRRALAVLINASTPDIGLLRRHLNLEVLVVFWLAPEPRAFERGETSTGSTG